MKSRTQLNMGPWAYLSCRIYSTQEARRNQTWMWLVVLAGKDRGNRDSKMTVIPILLMEGRDTHARYVGAATRSALSASVRGYVECLDALGFEVN